MKLKDVPTDCYILHHHWTGDRFGKFHKLNDYCVDFANKEGDNSGPGHSYFFDQRDLDDGEIEILTKITHPEYFL